jgi:hypothetical protein
MTVAGHPDILSRLEFVRQDVERRIATLDRFRALKAIEQTIADFPGLDDLARSLTDIRDQVRAQLDETREFRALRSIERILPELSEVLALVDDAPAIEVGDRPAASVPVEPAPVSAGPASVATQQAAVSETGPEAGEFEITASGPVDESGVLVQPAPIFAEIAGEPFGAIVEEGTDISERLSSEATPPEVTPPGADAESMPSLADSVAQLMAQSMSPQKDAHAPPSPHPQDRSDAALTHAERAA